MSWQEAAGLIGGFALVSFLVKVVVPVWHERRALRRSAAPPVPIGRVTAHEDEYGISLTGVIWTDVGIVHSMDIGGTTVSPGQGGISVDSLVQLKDNGCLSDTRGVVIHYDASPGYEAAIVRWASGIVTVETDVTRLVLDPFISPLAGVAR